MSVTNPAAIDQFREGQSFFVDFTPVPMVDKEFVCIELFKDPDGSQTETLVEYDQSRQIIARQWRRPGEDGVRRLPEAYDRGRGLCSSAPQSR